MTGQTSAAIDSHAGRTADSRGHAVHAVPAKVLLGVWALLMVLTVLTVAATEVDLGRVNIWVALLIATAKAGLVALYFMHLRYEHPFHGFALIVGLFFVTLFMGLAILDTKSYQPDFEVPSLRHLAPTPAYAPAAPGGH